MRYIWILHSKNDSGGKLAGMVKFGWSLHPSVLERNRNQDPPLCEPIGANSKVVRRGVLVSETSTAATRNKDLYLLRLPRGRP